MAVGAAQEAGVARTFNVGDGMLDEDALELDVEATRGMGVARTNAEQLDLMREEEGAQANEWALGQRLDTEEMQQMIPEAEGVLGQGPREEGEFAETFAWEGELGEEWGPQERLVPPRRGAGAPIPPPVQRDRGRLPMTAYELELLQTMVGSSKIHR